MMGVLALTGVVMYVYMCVVAPLGAIALGVGLAGGYLSAREW